MSHSSQRFFTPSDISDSIESLENIHGRERHYIYWAFLLVVGVAVASVFVVKVDVTVSGIGQIRPEIERLQVITTVSGYIEELEVVDNQPVSEGQTLLRFESKSLEAQIDHCRTEISENKRILSDLNVLQEEVENLTGLVSEAVEYDTTLVLPEPKLTEPLQSPRMLKEFANFNGQVERLKVEYEKANHDFLRVAKLRAKDFVSSQEYEDKRHEMETALRILRITILQKVNEWQAEYEERLLSASQLDSELRQLSEQLHLYEIKSPSDGTAIGFRGLHEGLLVPQGQTIGEISPRSRLLAEVYVSPKDVGFLSEGQQAKVIVDAFHHTEWGTLDGRITEISNDFVQLGDGIAFRAIVELDKLNLQSSKGVEVFAKRGMTVNSRFLIRRRTLFAILFSKMSDAFDPRDQE